jgi:hypothetical protein
MGVKWDNIISAVYRFQGLWLHQKRSILQYSYRVLYNPYRQKSDIFPIQNGLKHCFSTLLQHVLSGRLGTVWNMSLWSVLTMLTYQKKYNYHKEKHRSSVSS